MDCCSDLSLHHSELKSIRLCLIFTTFPFRNEKYYSMFIFDPTKKVVGEAKDEFIIKHPTIRIHPRDGRTTHAFYLYGSTLYMFQSGHLSQTKSVYTLDLSIPCVDLSLHSESLMAPIDVNEVDAEENLVEDKKIKMKKEADMMGWKYDVHAVATPNDKYLMVFSGELWADIELYEEEERFDFELYDLVNKSWTLLPNFDCKLFFSAPEDSHIFIDAVEFVTNDMFVIATSYGQFSLDINRKCWDKYKAKEAADDSGGEDEFNFTVSHVVRQVDGINVSTLPALMPLPAYVFAQMDNPLALRPDIRCLGKMLKADSQQLSFCIARATLDKLTDYKAYFTFDLFHTNLAKNKEKEKEKEEEEEEEEFPTTKLNSFGIMVAQQEDNFSFFDATQFFLIRI